MPSRSSTRSSRPSGGRVRTPRIRTSTAPTTSSGCRPRRAGRTSRRKPSNPPSADWWTMRWPASSATTRPSRAYCPRTTPALPSTRRASASSLISSATSGSATRRPALRTCSVASTSTSSPGSRAPKGRRAASSTPRVAWSSCWSRCSSPTAAGVRPLLRLFGHVRAVGRVHPRARERQRQRREGQGRHLDLRPGVELHHWGGERPRDDKRWKYGVPPVGNANFAWVQHIVHHLAPAGVAGFVLANGSMSSNQSGEGEIRKNLIEADLVDCMVALPGQLFYSTQIPACLWFLARDRKDAKFRDRRGQVLFVDARMMGRMVDRTHREFTDEDIRRIADTYHAWRGDPDAGEYRDIPGFCKSATLEEIRHHGYVLTPGRYVGAETIEDDGEPFQQKMTRLVAQLREQQAEAAKLDAAIARNLKELGFG